jgi:hypothetical protein
VYILRQLHNHHKARYKKEYQRIQLWFFLALLFDLCGIVCWSVGFIRRSGYIYIRVGETYSAFKLIAVNRSHRVVQDFTFLREQQGSDVQPPILLQNVGRATLAPTAMLSVMSPSIHSHAGSNQEY